MLTCVLSASSLLWAQQASGGENFTNSLGMKMVRIEAGQFRMGSEDGQWDEHPVNQVAISSSFYLGATEVTNAQYERFDPEHRKLRGKLGYSQEDDEAVVFVSWADAIAFCKWLSQKEGRSYRLPTEGEWEYACRAGTTTKYSTGDKLSQTFQKNVKNSWFPSRRDGSEVVPLHVGNTPPNAWGLHDMHGNVEEWCYDWYGPYKAGDCTDPVGPADGNFRVTRGGSHSTTLEYLRSANRMGTLPQDKHWLIGFRVALGQMPRTKPHAVEPRRRWARDVRQSKADWSKGPELSKPYFKGPIQYVNIPPGSEGPLYSRHNHCPALVACPNGDLLAIWYTCRSEPGRELGIAASRLRQGSNEWEEAEPFWNAPDRNDHASALYLHDDGTIYHFNGLGAAGTWGALATVMRTSTDNAATWSRARLIMPEHGPRHMPIETVFQTKEGNLIVPCDAVTGGGGGSAVLISRDVGETWTDPGEGREQPNFTEGAEGAWIAGIHAGVVQLRDGRLMAFGRGNTINGKMPMSMSSDMGQTWTYRASPFPPIGGGQRLVLTRLQEGPIFFASFASNMEFKDRWGNVFTGSGLFAALSYDEGRTWDIRRLITTGGPARSVDGGGNTGVFTMSETSAEPKGYMSVHQTPDGIIHLISSKQYYAFNLAWLKQDPPAPPPPPTAADLKPKARLEMLFNADRLPTDAGWRFNGTNTREEAVELYGGTLKIVTGKGQRVRWIGDSQENFGAASGAHTAKITMRVTRCTAGSRGIDFETYVPAVGRSFITVTTSAVYWFGGGFELLADNLDNTSTMHTYRLAVDVAGNVLVFRDNRLLGTRKTHPSRDNISGLKGAYLQWGEGAGASEADAIVDAVAFDIGGVYRP
jgi:formylglycine-generating enzyme required for sulfatase activity